MEAIKISNEAGLLLTVTSEYSEDCKIITGGHSEPKLWDEYLLSFKDEYQPHILLIRKAILELGWVGEKAEYKANQWHFVFSDGVKFGFSWRAWGDLMSSIVGKREGYMYYYL